ncbi:MAG: c-type cytochrome [Rhodospirillaceae bacterium]
MKKTLSAGVAAAAMCILISGGNAAAADLKAGSRVFNKCKACHSLEAGKNMIGPSLAGMFGRTAGTTDYNYSKAMKEAGAGGLVWSDGTVADYVRSPKDFVKGNKMVFVGIKKDSELENLIAFLRESTK